MKKEGFFRYDAVREDAADINAKEKKAPKPKKRAVDFEVHVEPSEEQSKQFF